MIVDRNDQLRYVGMLIVMRDNIDEALNRNKRAHAAAEMRGAMKAANRLGILPGTEFGLEMALTDGANMVEEEHGLRPQRNLASTKGMLHRRAWDLAWAERVVDWMNQ